jgi:hypothetical protein
MRYRITKEHVWVGAVEDRPGGVANKLKALSDAGLDLELIISRRDWSGQGLLFVSPLRTLDELDAAERAGLSKEKTILTLRVETPNMVGLGARLAGALAEARINMRDYSGAAIGDRAVTNIAFDSNEDTDRARDVLQALCETLFGD